MADSPLVINDTSYAGTFASFYWVPATFGLATIQKGLCYVHDGIKKQKTIDTLDFVAPFQPRAATPISSAASKVTIDGTVLNPQDIMLYFEFNPRLFEAHWEAEKLSPMLLARELPVNIENYMTFQALQRAFEQIETGLWMGSTAYQGAVAQDDPRYQIQFFDGWVRKALQSATNSNARFRVLIEASPVVLDQTNIGTAFASAKKQLATAKKALFADPNRYKKLKYIISVEDEQIFQDFLTIQSTYKGYNLDEAGRMKFEGYEVVSVPGLPKDTFFFGKATADVDTNFHVGMNSSEDNTLELARLQKNSELFFLKGLMKYDVQFGLPDQLYMSTTKTLADFMP